MERTDSFLQETVGLQPFDAIQLNHFTRVSFFLKNGLNPNLRDFQKRTLIMCSCGLAKQETALKFVNLLLKYKAKIELSDKNGMNALHYAVRSGHEKVVARFLEFSGNFDVNSRDNQGNTALMHAILMKNPSISEQIIKVLRRYDLSVDIVNNQGITPLIQATVLGQNQLAHCLVAVGRASEQIRDRHFRKSASEWERFATRRNQLPACYPPENRGIHSSPSHVLPVVNNEKGCGRYFEQLPELNPNFISRWSSSKEITGANSSTLGPYKWPDLKRVYELYEQELATSYRKSAPPRPKLPLPSSDTSSEESLWQKAALSVRLKQRRHTIALSRSLPHNLSTKLFFARRNIPDRTVERRWLGTGRSDQVHTDASKWCSLRRNSFRRQSDSQVPSTAPGGMETSCFIRLNQIKRRNSTSTVNVKPTDHVVKPVRRKSSVSFQSLKLNEEDEQQSTAQSPNTARSSSLKYGENRFSNRAAEENGSPIFEHEEDSVGTDLGTI